MLLFNLIILIATMYCLVGVLYYLISGLLFLIVYRIGKRTGAEQNKRAPRNKFLILIPAHNEEKVLLRLLKSVADIQYPKHLYATYVICDNCEDSTEEIAAKGGAIALARVDNERLGKGYAIEWALNKINADNYDVVLMADADTVLDNDILNKLNDKFSDTNVQALQCYNGVINPDDTPFTRLIALSRALEIMYMASRSYLGLSVHLIGNGMCFRPLILKKYPWKAFSISEDLEYFCILTVHGVRVHYSYRAKVYLQEERKLSHAQTQRQRWSSGRLQLIKKYASKIIWSGIRQKQYRLAEAAMILLVPNPSLLGNIIITILIVSIVFHGWWILQLLNLTLIVLLFIQIGGFSFFEVPFSARYFLSLLSVPIYLIWKGFIDLRSLLGFQKDQWIKTMRR